MGPLFTDELPEDLELVLDPGEDTNNKPPSQEAGDFEAAMHRLSELLEDRRYSKLKLSHDEISSIALAAGAPPLPEGAIRVRTINRRLKDLLNAAKRDSKPNSCEPIKPKHGRFRPTLLYDHQRRVAPSKVVEDAVPFCYVEREVVKDDDPEADYIAVLDRKHASEAEDCAEEGRPFDFAVTEEADRLRLRLTIIKSLGPAVQNCGHCGRTIPPDKPRSTVLRVEQPKLEEIGVIKRIAVHCDKCRDAEATILESGSWLADLTADELWAYELKRQGLNQTEIGEAMTPKRSQETVSRILKGVEQKRRAAIMATLRRTGGA